VSLAHELRVSFFAPHFFGMFAQGSIGERAALSEWDQDSVAAADRRN
jgi:hypothetical protein